MLMLIPVSWSHVFLIPALMSGWNHRTLSRPTFWAIVETRWHKMAAFLPVEPLLLLLIGEWKHNCDFFLWLYPTKTLIFIIQYSIYNTIDTFDVLHVGPLNAAVWMHEFSHGDNERFRSLSAFCERTINSSPITRHRLRSYSWCVSGLRPSPNTHPQATLSHFVPPLHTSTVIYFWVICHRLEVLLPTHLYLFSKSNRLQQMCHLCTSL